MKLLQVGGYKKNTQDKVLYAKVDDEDFERLSQYKWHMRERYVGCHPADGERYASGHVKPVPLHRMVMGNPPEGMLIDHINRDRLDNTRANLRFVTHKENGQNRSIRKNNKSGYIGVHWRKVDKKWQASIRVDGKLHYLGDYLEKEDAARVYNEAATKYFGEFAVLNSLHQETQ